MAQYEEFSIDQGADVAVEIHCVNKDNSAKDLTGFSVSSKLKKTYASDSAETTLFTSIVATPASDGILTISLTNTQTDTLKAGRYVYDVELLNLDSDSNTIIERVLEGRVQVTPSVTR
tara:strand:- start:4192 stop:4545 length:354 start_codon:yes stop_codon:yes gene_type:complete